MKEVAGNGELEFETLHVLDSGLPHGFPEPEFLPRDPLDVSHVGVEGWTGYMPPEDRAIAPNLLWTESHQILIAAAYQKAWGKYLDGDDFVEYSWPPTASLTTEGYVIEPEFGCDHQGEECPASEECLSAPGHIEPAQWDWRVRVDTTRGIDSDHATDDSGYFWFMSTLMDPRAVDYES